jgi:hypothetical protein
MIMPALIDLDRLGLAPDAAICSTCAALCMRALRA